MSDVEDFSVRIERHIRRQAELLVQNAETTPLSLKDARVHKGIPYAYSHPAVARQSTAFDSCLQEVDDPEIRIVRALDILIKTAKYHGFHAGFNLACEHYKGEDHT